MKNSEGSREDLEQSAEMLEQILEVMPDDLFTLRALYETSLELERPEKAFEALTALDDQARAAQNAEMMDFVINQYAPIASHSAQVQSRMGRLQELQAALGLGVTKEEPVAEPEGVTSLEAEMALAWDLYQDEQLTQEEYASVLHDLTEVSTGDMGVPVTVLHILHDRQFSRFERLMTHICQKSGTPIMQLAPFEQAADMARLIPLSFCSRQGAMPFAKVGDDLLLAMLNPMDTQLLAEAEQLCGCTCHPYLVSPEEYDRLLERVKQRALDLAKVSEE